MKNRSLIFLGKKRVFALTKNGEYCIISKRERSPCLTIFIC